MERTYYLRRYINAQEDGTKGATYQQALSEIKAGAKRSHWVWYVFPQIKGIPGVHSPNALFYSLVNRDEAKAYIGNETLASHMREILTELLKHKGKDIISIMGGEIDARKLRSSMTVFYYATQEQIFKDVIDTFFYGTFDNITVGILSRQELGARRNGSSKE